MTVDQAWWKLYRRFNSIRGFCYRLLDDWDEAEDAAAACIAKAIERLDQYQGRGFWSWFGMLARNHCTNLLRKRKREKVWIQHKTRLAYSPRGKNKWATVLSYDPRPEIEACVLLGQAWDAITDVGEGREQFRLWTQGWTLEQIAAKFGEPYSTVRVRLWRIGNALRDWEGMGEKVRRGRPRKVA